MKVLHISMTLPQEPLGPMWLSRAVKDSGHDMQALFIPDPHWIDKVKDYAPDVISWSSMTGVHRTIEATNRVLKDHYDAFTVMGGPHPTFVPDTVKDPAVDAICLGEGEGALVELLDTMEKGGDVKKIANLCFDDGNGGILRNEPRPLVDLESLGIPDRSVIYDAQSIYRDSARKVVVTQRGCPMMCSFCFHHAWKEKIYKAKNSEYVRKRSVSHVIEEVEMMRSQYPLRFVHFLDDIFNLKEDWLEEFGERWPREVGLPFDAILMANMTKENHIKILKNAGAIYARIAFEAANDFVRNTVFRKNTERDQLTRVAGWINQYGIRLGSLNMLGGPGGTLEDELDTVRLNIESKVDHPLVSIVQPYPEFELNDITREMGIAVDDYDDFPTKFNRTATIDVRDKTAVENLHKWFPMVVKMPSLMPVAKLTMKQGWLKKPLLATYMLYSEWMVTEMNVLYNRALGINSWKDWPPIDFLWRVATKGFMLVNQTLGGKMARRMALKLQMGDERVIAHMD